MHDQGLWMQRSSPVKAIWRPWWWYIMEVTPSYRYPSNLYSSTHQRALDSRKRSVSQLPARKHAPRFGTGQFA